MTILTFKDDPVVLDECKIIRNSVVIDTFYCSAQNNEKFHESFLVLSSKLSFESSLGKLTI